MGELEDRIGSVLNDPKQMEQIMGMARSLMGGEENGAQPDPSGGLSSLLQGLPGGGAPEVGLLSRLGGLLRDQDGEKDRRALLEAMKPWLSPRRRDKLERAMRMAKLARLASAALSETGGEGHV